MIIAIDFDATLVVGDKPIKGAREALNNLREKGHKIVIHSCNNKNWIENVMRNNDMRYDWIWDQVGKPIASVYIDDRGLHFNGDWEQTLAAVDVMNGEGKGILW